MVRDYIIRATHVSGLAGVQARFVYFRIFAALHMLSWPGPGHLSFSLFLSISDDAALDSLLVWANVLLQGIIVPSGCCVHEFVLMPPAAELDTSPTGKES